VNAYSALVQFFNEVGSCRAVFGLLRGAIAPLQQRGGSSALDLVAWRWRGAGCAAPPCFR